AGAGIASRRRQRLSLKCVAVEVGPVLQEHLFSREIGIVMTSATLATGGAEHASFKHIATRLGCDSAETLALGSPFDHARQMRFIVDASMPEPTHPDYTEELCPRLERHIRATDGGAFVLFTSFNMLNRVAERLRETLAEWDL